MTIFVEAVARVSECFKATQRPSYEFAALFAGRSFGQRPVHPKVTGRDQIADQDARDTHRQVQPGRDFGDRGTVDAHLGDPPARVIGWPLVSQSRLQRLNRRFQRKVDIGAGPPGREGVRANQARLT
jgi:hypothetical protein